MIDEDREWLEDGSGRSTVAAIGGNKAAAAGALGMSRSSLYRRLREYHLG